ncbi:HNH endonuclease signature motif containing protein [Bacillus carboniphilus]|uniref:HNH endonuclease signature motif containing protein n=1 Tax=Bacillus carboniphilus TaxID=86663 RepID=A0ABY9JVV5_9BACI|nr:HNH endonuclease signature motif containing protein [Bacillus carboniphilus]WLR42628.1 HNH endonuclease signature motif containing protein [Bacillus carboniphilus]
MTANGFGEYLTRQDMFGNPLTDAQRQDSLHGALLGLTIGTAAHSLNRQASGQTLFPYSKAYVGQKVTQSQQALSKLRSNIGQLRVPVGVEAQQLATNAGRVTNFNLNTKTLSDVKHDWIWKSETGPEHIGKLKGENILLKGIREKDITYTKRPREEFKQLRNKFNSSVRKNFLLDLTKSDKKIKILLNAGLSKTDINDMKNGFVPEGYQVHHKLPLDDGGTNDFSNLILIKNDPYHKVLTNSQRTLTRGIKVGDSIIIKWPIPKGFVYPETKN